MTYNAPRSTEKAALEALEDRRLFSSVSLSHGVLAITGGSSGALHVEVGYNPAHDTIRAIVKGQPERDFPLASVRSIQIVGTPHNDSVLIDSRIHAPATISTGAGNDWIVGGSGNDIIDAGAGNDVVYGGAGNDVIHGGAGNDRIYGGSGNDTLYGDAGKNLLSGGAGNDTLYGVVGVDRMQGGPGHNQIRPTPPAADGPTAPTVGTGKGTTGGTGTGSTGGTGTGTGTTSGGSTSGSGTGTTSGGSTSGAGSTKAGGSSSGGSSSGGSSSGGTKAGGTQSGGSVGAGPGSKGSGTPTVGSGNGNFGGTVGAEPGPNPAPSARIDVIGQTGMAGHVVHVNALNSKIFNGDAVGARFEWDFGDPSGTYNTLVGFNAAHVYERAGNYTVTLTLTDVSGKTSVATSTITIKADGRRQIYVDANGNDSNNGATPGTAVRTLARAASLLGDNTELLIHRDQTFSLADTITIPYSNVLVDSYGGSALPIIQKGRGNGVNCFYTTAAASDVLFQNLAFDSIWGLDSVYGTRKIPAKGFTIGGTNIGVVGCTFNNVTDGANCELSPTGVLIQGCYFSQNLRAYGIWGEGTDHVYLGNTLTDSKQEHLIRADYDGSNGTPLTRVLIADNNLSRLNNGKGCLELRTASWFYVTGNTFKNGTLRAGLQEVPKSEFPTWASWKTEYGVIENNTTDNTIWNLRPGLKHLAIRNNVIHMDGGPALRLQVSSPGYDQVANRQTTDVRIDHNTAVCNSTGGEFLEVLGHATKLTLTNNVYLAPNLAEGGGGTSGAVFVTDSDLSGFTLISGNVWPALKDSAKQAGLNYVGQSMGDPNGFITGQQWDNLPQVSGDLFQDFTVSEAYRLRVGSSVVTPLLKVA